MNTPLNKPREKETVGPANVPASMSLFKAPKLITFDWVVRVGFTCFVLWAMVYTAAFLSDVLIPFIVAILIAYLMNPLVALIQRKIPQRSAAVFLALATVSLLLLGLGYLCVHLVINEMLRFAHLVQQLAHDQVWKQQLIALMPEHMVHDFEHGLSKDGIIGMLNSEGAWEYLSNSLVIFVPWLKSIGGGLIAVLGLSVIVLYVVFLLIDYDWFRKNWNKILPQQQRAGVDGFLQEFEIAMQRHFRAQALIAVCCAILFALGFSLIGLPLAILFGIFVGLLNMIPYVQILALIPAALLAIMQSLETANSLSMALLWVVLVFMVVQIIQDAILVPRIMGEAFGLRPVVILLSIMVWGKILGLLGLIIALPLTCLAWAWYRRLVLLPQELAAEESLAPALAASE